ncbi:hypothetical protein SAMN05443634_10253 [Chishuiella changwenlii]|uniref:Two-component sensor histidine kinase n=1 Tax=Chishuiella changwenlii TaxID=1434701 RepID=A0A1M6TRA1_9FLAO|nr:tetratricopeptide repeat-containing sensor histidine kinase [Chishuiella changwenlii]GGF04040.1 two-component sensor histidine kinase [Chishuiella changwenlii]SHK59358.1 hypothetical protein SAMN05443634_10253 [Chishuiella changwenlii]
MRYFYFCVILLVLFSCSGNEKQQNLLGTGDEFYDKGEALYGKNNDSAYYYFNQAFDEYQKNNDSIKSSNALIYQSFIQNEEGDYYGSIETNIRALELLGKSKNNLLSIYNSIAIAKGNLKDYKESVNWYEKALLNIEDNKDRASIENNIAVDLSKEKKYDRAINILENLIKEQGQSDKILKARVMDNLAFNKFLKDSTYNALPELYDALKIREDEKDFWGQNASYAHLSDYFYKKDKAKSLLYAQKMLAIAKELESPDDQLEALQKLILLESSESSRGHFINYQQLDYNLQTARSKAKNQFALIRFETEKERAENVKKQNHILKQYIVIGLLTFFVIGGLFWYRKRKKRLQQEKELEVKNTQIKYSKKVHDVVANGLYHTMMQIQNNSAFGKEQMLNNIEKLYEESRDIARDDLNEIYEKDFSVRLAEMLNSYSNETNKVFIVGNSPEKWETITNNVQTEILYTLRECMINMMKHSKAKLVSVKFEKSEDFLMIKYTDNGVGIDDVQKKSTSGIRNMENRIVTIGGKITFEKNPANGLIIQITIPT